MNHKGTAVFIKFGEFGKASVRQLCDSMPNAKDFSW